MCLYKNSNFMCSAASRNLTIYRTEKGEIWRGLQLQEMRNVTESVLRIPFLHLPFIDYSFWPVRIQKSENMNLTDSSYDPLHGVSACRKAATCNGQHKHRKSAHIHLRLEWDSNLLSQCSKRRKYFVLDCMATVFGPLLCEISNSK
jgi:hypothetical protein